MINIKNNLRYKITLSLCLSNCEQKQITFFPYFFLLPDTWNLWFVRWNKKTPFDYNYVQLYTSKRNEYSLPTYKTTCIMIRERHINLKIEYCYFKWIYIKLLVLPDAPRYISIKIFYIYLHLQCIFFNLENGMYYSK